MAPSTRSGGKTPPQTTIYQSEPKLRQVQFPARRKQVRQYGKKGNRRVSGNFEGRNRNKTPMSGEDLADEAELDPEELKRRLRQQTLTQIDFVPRSSNPVVEMSESEGEKENQTIHDSEGEEDTWDMSDEEDEDLVPSSRRKRTALTKTSGNEEPTGKKRKLHAEDGPSSRVSEQAKRKRQRILFDDEETDDLKSKYHTQTLTQFIGRRSFIKDSDDEDEEEPTRGDDGFADWLHAAGAPSPKLDQGQPITEGLASSPLRNIEKPLRSAMKKNGVSPSKSTQGSLVPQTPVKKIQFEIPSSSQLTTPTSTAIKRYGSIGEIGSPSPSQTKSDVVKTRRERNTITVKPPRSRIVVEDSFETGSWTSSDPKEASAGNSLPGASTQMECEVPSNESLVPASPILDREVEQIAPEKPPTTEAAASKGGSGLMEIPDSDDEGGDFDFDDALGASQMEFNTGDETQFVMNQIANGEDSAPSVPSSSGKEQRRDAVASSTTPSPAPGRVFDDAIQVNSERTTRTMPSSPPPLSLPPMLPKMMAPSRHERASTGSEYASRKPVTPPPNIIRRPLNHTSPAGTFTQPIESQRVPANILRDMPPVTDRSDIFLPVSSEIVNSVVKGYDDHMTFSFKIPNFVSRFWLFENDLLQYMACPQPNSSASFTNGQWTYKLEQVYKLNNPVPGSRIQEEDWLKQFPPSRYAYVPPAVVGEVLWNLRHALFGDDPEEETMPSSPILPKKKTQPYNPTHPARVASKASRGNTNQDDQPSPHNAVVVSSSTAPTASISVSQQVAQQLHSESTQFQGSDDVLVPSTPDAEDNTSLNLPKSDSPTIIPAGRHEKPSSVAHQGRHTGDKSQEPSVHPSQTTTLSQPSTQQQPPLQLSGPQSSSIFQQSQLAPAISLPDSLYLSTQSQALLTKSQMLPDSLVRENVREPPSLYSDHTRSDILDEDIVLNSEAEE